MKFVILSDTHCGIRNSSSIFIDYQERFYSEVLFPYMLENDIKHIVHLGDYYENRKFINFRALNANRVHFLAKLREYGMTMDIIPGNHDTYFRNTNDLNSLKELLGHYMEEVNIIMKPTVMTYDGMKMALIPWIAPDNHKKTMSFLKRCKADILGAHLELAGFEVYPGMKMAHGMDTEPFSKFEMVLSGHYHTKSHSDNIYYLGSQMEFFWNDAGDPKYFHVMDTSNRELTPVQNPITLFEKIYYNDGDNSPYDNNHWFNCDLDYLNDKFVKVIVVDKNDLYQFEQFIDRVQNMQIHELKIAENFKEFVGENVDDGQVDIENTETLLDSYIDAVNTNLDKGVIKRQVNELMIEAQSLEIS